MASAAAETDQGQPEAAEKALVRANNSAGRSRVTPLCKTYYGPCRTSLLAATLEVSKYSGSSTASRITKTPQANAEEKEALVRAYNTSSFLLTMANTMQMVVSPRVGGTTRGSHIGRVNSLNRFGKTLSRKHCSESVHVLDQHR